VPHRPDVAKRIRTLVLTHVAVQLDYDPLALSAARPSSIRPGHAPHLTPFYANEPLHASFPDVPYLPQSGTQTEFEEF